MVVGGRLAAELIVLGIVLLFISGLINGMGQDEKQKLRFKSKEMFLHGYKSYMNNAYPADELMPLSCRGRFRGTEQSRGDIDDALGNFSLTLIDTLDTLLVVGEVEEFENAVQRVIEDVTFDTDVVVSVFETNIRVLGGLLGGHMMAEHVKHTLGRMPWYNGQLLIMATDLGNRLLPAFNTSTGIPFPRVNLRYGVKHDMSRTGSERDTCTACAGSMILEFSALSRLTNNKIYEEKASKAMDYLWKSRHRASDLVGTVINIHNGDWVRRDSGIGAGIDSYYEYLLKAYIMLGDETFLNRFNRHYRAIMKYISNGPLMVDVHMHKPYTQSRNFMDALLAFWPGVQVLKGDLKSAIELHEMLYQVMQRHNFLPEAFTTEFRVHWANHPLRPEFVESTYFIYKATGDPYYLSVGKSVLDNLEQHARVPCGFAAIKDVTTGRHEDQMDSYVLAETFKYLYLLFTDKDDLLLDVDEYVFSTEAHLLPLFLSTPSGTTVNSSIAESTPQYILDELAADDDDMERDRTCPSTQQLFKGTVDYAHSLRTPLKNFVENLCPRPKSGNRPARLKASQFVAGNLEHIAQLSRMGVRLITMSDGRVQLLHIASEAASTEDSNDGLLFMQDMIEMSKLQSTDVIQQEPRFIQLMSHPYNGFTSLKGGPAQFGMDLKGHAGVNGEVVIAEPLRGCTSLENAGEVVGKFVIVERGDCMFIDKARQIQAAGGLGGIVFDNNSQSSSDNQPLFAMSGDGKTDVTIPMVFLFYTEAQKLKRALMYNPQLIVHFGESLRSPDDGVIKNLLSYALKDSEPGSTSSADNSEGAGANGAGVGASLGMEQRAFGKSEDSVEPAGEEKQEPSKDNQQIVEILETLLTQINLDELIPALRDRATIKWYRQYVKQPISHMYVIRRHAWVAKSEQDQGMRSVEELSREIYILGADLVQATDPSGVTSETSAESSDKTPASGAPDCQSLNSQGRIIKVDVIGGSASATVKDCDNDVLGCSGEKSIINTNEEKSTSGTDEETSGMTSNDIRREREKADRRRENVVRGIYVEFVMLLKECTTLAQVDNLAQITSALARLTERVLTGGRMSYGVHTDQILNGLSSILTIKSSCKDMVSGIKDNPEPDSSEAASDVKYGPEVTLPQSAPGQSAEGAIDSGTITSQFDTILDAYIQIQLRQLLKSKPADSASSAPSSSSSSNSGPSSEAGASSRDFSRDVSIEERIKAAGERASALLEAAVRKQLNVPDKVLTSPTWMNLRIGDLSISADGKMYTQIGNEGDEIELPEDVIEVIGTPQRSPSDPAAKDDLPQTDSSATETSTDSKLSHKIDIEVIGTPQRPPSDLTIKDDLPQSQAESSTPRTTQTSTSSVLSHQVDVDAASIDEIYNRIESNIEAAGEILRALDSVDSTIKTTSMSSSTEEASSKPTTQESRSEGRSSSSTVIRINIQENGVESVINIGQDHEKILTRTSDETKEPVNNVGGSEGGREKRVNDEL